MSDNFYDTSGFDPDVPPLHSMRLRAGYALDTISAGVGAVIDAVEEQNFQAAVEVLKAMREARNNWIDDKLTDHYAEAQRLIADVKEKASPALRAAGFEL